MDIWKPIRLWLCIIVIVAFLAAGLYARLRWGMPDEPYGDARFTEFDGEQFVHLPNQLDPFIELQRDFLWADMHRLDRER